MIEIRELFNPSAPILAEKLPVKKTDSPTLENLPFAKLESANRGRIFSRQRPGPGYRAQSLQLYRLYSLASPAPAI